MSEPYFRWAKVRIAAIICAVLVAAGCAAWLFFSPGATFPTGRIIESLVPCPTPWASVGGCGAGGSGGGSADGIRWVGTGVSGGLIDLQLLPKYNFGQNFQYLTIAPRFSFKPTYVTTVGVTVPVESKSGEVQYYSNQAPNNRTTGGLGDVAIDVSRAIGMEGQYSLNFTLGAPTGQYDIERGADAAQAFLPTSLQKGGGVYSATFGLTYTRDIDKDNMWILDGAYCYPFNMKLFSGKNEFLDTYFSDYAGLKSDRRFYYRFKPYGENDLGDYSPPSATASVYWAYRGVENYVHSFGLAFAAPLGVAWIHSEKVGQYDPRPDPDNKAWSAALVYGLEFSRPKYPVFVAISLPIHDKSNAPNPNNAYDPTPMAKWDGPDMKDFLQQWTVALGIKSTMF